MIQMISITTMTMTMMMQMLSQRRKVHHHVNEDEHRVMLVTNVVHPHLHQSVHRRKPKQHLKANNPLLQMMPNKWILIKARNRRLQHQQHQQQVKVNQLFKLQRKKDELVDHVKHQHRPQQHRNQVETMLENCDHGNDQRRKKITTHPPTHTHLIHFFFFIRRSLRSSLCICSFLCSILAAHSLTVKVNSLTSLGTSTIIKTQPCLDFFSFFLEHSIVERITIKNLFVSV